MDLADIKVYRMIHIDNIPHVLQKGITHRNSPNRNPDFIAIGDISLIQTRDNKQVIVDNGNILKFDSPLITLGDFIPFYFGVRMPMLYVIQNGGNFVKEAIPAKDIVYLVCVLSHLIKLQENYYFSDGHATDNFTTFYDSSKIGDLPKIIDWNSVMASYWSGQENLNVKRKKQAEFLVADDIAPKFITGYGCYNENAKEKLLALKIQPDKIKIIPHAYY